MIRLLDLFSGIGGFSLGLERSGFFRTVAFCEVDPFCRRVLAKHWSDVPCHEDVTTREFHEGEADAICGGFPCQDVSLAGKRAGVSGARSGLYRELVRAIRVVRPRVALLENVAALLSDGMGTVLGDLAEIGSCIEWDCVPAIAVGAPHERDRVWIVAHANSFDGRTRTAWQDRPKTRDGTSETSPDSSSEQVGSSGQPRRHVGVGSSSSDPEILGCRQGRSRRPPDSFARVRDEARRNAADPLGARLAFCRRGADPEGRRHGRFCEPGRESNGNSIWPDEPALSRVDDGSPNWMDRIRATGNGLIPYIPELIARAIGEAMVHA